MQWKRLGIAISSLFVSTHAFMNNMPMIPKKSELRAMSVESGIMHLTPRYYIRDAKKDDLAQVADLMILSFTPEMNDPIRKLFEMCRLQTTFPLSDEQHLFLVACELTSYSDGNDRSDGDEERIIGFCKVDGREHTDMFRTLSESFSQYKDAIPSTPYATDLAVHPNHRRMGVGKEIMRQVEVRMRSWENVGTLYLGVETDNQYALNMYRDMGYEILIEGMSEKNRSIHLLRRRLR